MNNSYYGIAREEQEEYYEQGDEIVSAYPLGNSFYAQDINKNFESSSFYNVNNSNTSAPALEKSKIKNNTPNANSFLVNNSNSSFYNDMNGIAEDEFVENDFYFYAPHLMSDVLYDEFESNLLK